MVVVDTEFELLSYDDVFCTGTIQKLSFLSTLGLLLAWLWKMNFAYSSRLLLYLLLPYEVYITLSVWSLNCSPACVVTSGFWTTCWSWRTTCMDSGTARRGCTQLYRDLLGTLSIRCVGKLHGRDVYEVILKSPITTTKALSTLHCKAKRRYLLTWEVSRYRIVALHGWNRELHGSCGATHRGNIKVPYHWRPCLRCSTKAKMRYLLTCSHRLSALHASTAIPV